MHDRLALTLQDDLTEHIVKHRAHGVMIDISGLEMVDSFIAACSAICKHVPPPRRADRGGRDAAVGGDYAVELGLPMREFAPPWTLKNRTRGLIATVMALLRIRRAEESLRRSNESLRSLNDMLSHELREPLRQVSIYAEYCTSV